MIAIILCLTLAAASAVTAAVTRHGVVVVAGVWAALVFGAKAVELAWGFGS